MNDKTLETIKNEITATIKVVVNHKIDAMHDEMVENQKLQVIAHGKLQEQIKKLGEQIAPWDNSRTWVKQLIRGLIYVGMPAASAYGIYKFFSIFK